MLPSSPSSGISSLSHLIISLSFSLYIAPDGPPRDLVVYSNSSSSIIVTWEPPDLSLQNGVITYHYITCTSIQSEQQLTVNTTELQLQLNDLETFTDYNIAVASGTAIGIGPFTSTMVTTLNKSKQLEPLERVCFACLFQHLDVRLMSIPHIILVMVLLLCNGLLHKYPMESLQATGYVHS